MTVVYDAGVLIAADRNDRATWADHRVRLESGMIPMTTAPVVAQASRSARQVPLQRFLSGCQVVEFTADDAHNVGALLAASGTSDVVDGHVVSVAVSLTATVLTSAPGDIGRLMDATPNPVPVVSI